MRAKFVWLVAVAALVLPLCASVRAEADTAPPATALSAGDVLVDEAGGHVFVTASDTVAVFDLSGNRVGTISGEYRAVDLLLQGRTLYVLARNSNRVDTIDADTLAVTGGWDLPGVSLAWQMAWTKGAIWISYGDQWGDGVAKLNTTTGAVTLNIIPNLYAQPAIASTTNPPRIYTLDRLSSPAEMHIFDVSSGTPTLVSSTPFDADCGGDEAVNAAGTRAFLGCPGGIGRWDTSSLVSPITTYAAGGYLNTIALSGDERVLVGGANAHYGNDLFVYDVSQPSAQKVFEIGPSDLMTGMVAADHDGNIIYAVDGAGTLHTYDLRPAITVRPDAAPAETETTVPVAGNELAAVTGVTVGGVAADFTIGSDHLLNVTVPELPAGSYPIVLSSRWGNNVVSNLAEIDLVALGPDAPPAPTVTGAPPFAVSLSWSAPDSTSPISEYRVRAYVGDAGAPVAHMTVDGATTTATFDGLIAETGYRFTVTAVNDDGVGTYSAPSALAAAGLPDISPFDSLTSLINRQYRDVIGRGPTSTERAMWLDSMRAGDSTATDLVLALRASDDNVKNIDAVDRLYLAYFGRPANTSGLTYWTAKRRGGTSLNTVSDAFASSSEFRRTYAGLSNRQFVELVYQRVLGRPGDRGGVAYWTGQIDTGRKTRGTVMVGFSESTEYVREQASEVTASVVPVLLLGHAPTHDDYVATVDALDAGTATATSIVTGILAGPEYADRVAAG